MELSEEPTVFQLRNTGWHRGKGGLETLGAAQGKQNRRQGDLSGVKDLEAGGGDGGRHRGCLLQ